MEKITGGCGKRDVPERPKNKTVIKLNPQRGRGGEKIYIGIFMLRNYFNVSKRERETSLMLTF